MKNQNDAPFISIIIITRNRARILVDCLDHLAQQSYGDFEIIVVDSSNNEDTKKLVKSYPALIYHSIWDGRNNMPAARNAGISCARGDIVAFIDDDSMVFPNWLENIVLGYINEKIGGVGGSTIDERLKIDPNDKRVGLIYPDGMSIPNFNVDLLEPFYVDWFVGCNMSYRRSVLVDLGGFDGKYGGDNSYEEVDMATRVRTAGFDLLFVPAAKVVHIRVPRDAGVVSRDFEAPRLRYHQAHNRAYYVLKNIGLNKTFIKYILKTLYGLAVYAIKRPSMAAWKRLGATLLGFVSGCWDALWGRVNFGIKKQNYETI
jgi:GT2 family glycosyltransferase